MVGLVNHLRESKDMVGLKTVKLYSMEWEDELFNLPDHLQGGISRYLREGIAPGHFLTAVITNNLVEAVSRADPTSLRALPDIVKFFYNYTPSGCWGTQEKMVAWMKGGTDDGDT
jgi:hypothetical protein